MRTQTSALLAVIFASLLPSTLAGDFSPDPDGWIRHWIIYGPFGRFGEQYETRPPEFHPITLEPLIFSDFIAEAEGKENRWTERNLLPAPGKEIDTAFGTVLPGHILRPEAGAGLNPNGRPMGIGWVACECTANLDSAFNFDSSENDGPGGDFNRDVRHYVSYDYTYVENLTGERLMVYPAFGYGDIHTIQVWFGRLPLEAGADFLELLFDGNDRLTISSDSCIESAGPPPLETEEGSENRVEVKKFALEPGMNLILLKRYAGVFWDGLRFRLRSAIPPYPPITEGIRIRFYPEPDQPDPVLFRRMDVDGDGSMMINDAVRILEALWLGGRPLPCRDAADANDDGEIDIADAISTLNHLFANSGRIPAPFRCCGIDPTIDDLDCASFPPCN